MFSIITPYSWRKGQAVFNFLEWLQQKGFVSEQSGRMADPFHISDERFDELYNEFLEEQK